MAPTRVHGTVFYQFYRGIAALAAPLVWRVVSRKLTRHGVPQDRQRERLGYATRPRPEGQLVWFHAASVGESLSILTLAREMAAQRPGLQILITSGTATSAQVLAKRLPDGMIHQFAPLDQQAALRRFLAHWHPDAGIFVESELWPQMLVEAHDTDIPLALVNARMSKTSLKNWKRFDHTARYLLGLFRLIRTQDRATLDGLMAIGADPARVAMGPNLKASAAPLPVDEAELAKMRAAFPGPVWLAASTHEGEEKQVLKAHQLALKAIPNLRLILVPRHPERAGEIQAQIETEGLRVARHSAGGPADQADVYLADTLGDLGLWYRLCRVVFLGGSLGSAGGHNPFEPAQMSCAILSGAKVANFADVYDEFQSKDAVRMVKSASQLGKTVAALMSQPDDIDRLGTAAATIAQAKANAIEGLAQDLTAILWPGDEETRQ